MANDEQKDEEQKDQQKDQQKDEENKEKKDDLKLEYEQKKDDRQSENEEKKEDRKSENEEKTDDRKSENEEKIDDRKTENEEKKNKKGKADKKAEKADKKAEKAKKKAEKKDKKKNAKDTTKQIPSAADTDVNKIPAAKLRVAGSTLALEDTSEDSLVYEKTDKNIQKYQMYLGGFQHDQARKKYHEKKEKARKEKWQRELEAKKKKRKKEEREAKIKHKLNKIQDEKLLPVTDRKKVKLLHDGTYEEFNEDNLVYYHNPRTRVYLILVFIITEAFGIAFLTLLPIYAILESKTIDTYLKKGYKRKGKTIHYTIGALWVFVYGNGFIIFRITSAYKLTLLKWVHALIYAVAIPIPIYCVDSYFYVKEDLADVTIQEHFYSLHSFLGFFAIYLYIFELCCGCIVYSVSMFRQVYKNIYYQVHTYISLLGFIMAVSTLGLGITMEEFDIKIKASTPEPLVAVYLYLAGTFACLFAILALFLIINPDFDVEKDLPLTMKY